MPKQSFMSRLKSRKWVDTYEPATTEDVAAIRKSLGLRLPADYKRFLLACGSARIDGLELYGRGPATGAFGDIVRRNLEARAYVGPRATTSLLVLMDDGAGNLYCLDTAKLANGRCPVVLWDHEHPRPQSQRCARVADSFEAWVNKMLDDLDARHTLVDNLSDTPAKTRSLTRKAPDFIVQLRSHHAVVAHRGASKADVLRIQERFGVRLPTDYQQFLMHCGWASVVGRIVYGAGPDSGPATAVDEKDFVEHAYYNAEIMPGHVPVCDTDDGALLVLDTNRMKGGVCPVVRWVRNHPQDVLQRTKKVAPSFEAWLLKWLRQIDRVAPRP